MKLINMEDSGNTQRLKTPQIGLNGETDSLFDHENQYSVLHIDDDEQTLKLSKYFIEEVCSKENLVVESESDSSNIQTWLDQDHDLYLIDYYMPNKNGLAVCKQIRKLKETPIILFTSMRQDEIPFEDFKELNVTYHQKSSDPKNYFQLTNAILELVQADTKTGQIN